MTSILQMKLLFVAGEIWLYHGFLEGGAKYKKKYGDKVWSRD
uniref:Uncharacterized protein n=1 Tax=Trichinella nativa TaxID=6335 RepID=A0A0V1KII6_9BILA